MRYQNACRLRFNVIEVYFNATALGFTPWALYNSHCEIVNHTGSEIGGLLAVL